MFKSIGVAAFGGAVGLPVLGIAAIGIGLVGAGFGIGYLVGGKAFALGIAGAIAAA